MKNLEMLVSYVEKLDKNHNSFNMKLITSTGDRIQKNITLCLDAAGVRRYSFMGESFTLSGFINKVQSNFVGVEKITFPAVTFLDLSGPT